MRKPWSAVLAVTGLSSCAINCRDKSWLPIDGMRHQKQQQKDEGERDKMRKEKAKMSKEKGGKYVRSF